MFHEMGKNLTDSFRVSATRTLSPREGRRAARDWVTSTGAGAQAQHLEGSFPLVGAMEGLQRLEGGVAGRTVRPQSRWRTGLELGGLAGVLRGRTGRWREPRAGAGGHLSSVLLCCNHSLSPNPHTHRPSGALGARGGELAAGFRAELLAARCTSAGPSAVHTVIMFYFLGNCWGPQDTVGMGAGRLQYHPTTHLPDPISQRSNLGPSLPPAERIPTHDQHPEVGAPPPAPWAHLLDKCVLPGRLQAPGREISHQRTENRLQVEALGRGPSWGGWTARPHPQPVHQIQLLGVHLRSCPWRERSGFPAQKQHSGA